MTKPIGGHSARLPEASDSLGNSSLRQDGADGDVDFQFGNLKPIATVGEVDYKTGMVLAGVPDGMGAMLADDDTVRVVVQSESYGPVSSWESYPYMVNDGAAGITGSHVQYVDYDRQMMSQFMSSGLPASSMVKGAGSIIEKMFNLRGEAVGPRNANGPTTVGAMESNVDADGNLAIRAPRAGGVGGREADWTMMSLCSAHLAEKELWGAQRGFADDIFLTNEEWMTYRDNHSFVGLPTHAIDIATKTSYAWGAATLSGFEKTVNFDSGSTEYIALGVSGYNCNCGTDASPSTRPPLAARSALGVRPDGNAWVWPENIVPARVYIGRKGVDDRGNPAQDFLSRNGLRYGQIYGFAADSAAEGFMWRDEWHRNNYNGANMSGKFYPIDWRWNGTVANFEHDGAWHFQIDPKGAAPGFKFWNANGNDQAGSKTEHVSPDPQGTAFWQTSTAGYFGKYVIDNMGATLSAVSGAEDPFPAEFSATYHLYQGETPVNHLIDLGVGGKGQTANGQDQTTMCDSQRDQNTCALENMPGKLTFEDVDGFEAIPAAGGKVYSVFQEDGKNQFGERMFIYENSLEYGENPATKPFKFLAHSGGESNSRNRGLVGVPAGSNGGAEGHEFSGITDLSGFFVRSGDAWALSASDAGHEKMRLAATVAIDDKLIILNLQGHSLNAGLVKKFNADRGGQWLLWKPRVSGDGQRPQETTPPEYPTYPCNPFTTDMCAIHPAVKAELDAACPEEDDSALRFTQLSLPVLVGFVLLHVM